MFEDIKEALERFAEILDELWRINECHNDLDEANDELSNLKRFYSRRLENHVIYLASQEHPEASPGSGFGMVDRHGMYLDEHFYPRSGSPLIISDDYDILMLRVREYLKANPDKKESFLGYSIVEIEPKIVDKTSLVFHIDELDS